MLVDISVLLKGPQALIVAATLTTVALFGKWFAALFTQLIFRFTGAQRQLIFGLSSAHAAATLAVILVGYNAGILDENILNGTIILILVTCVVASFATERAARKVLLSSEERTQPLEDERPPTEEHILLPLANIANFGKLLELALFIRDKASRNPVSLLTVVPNNEEAELNILKSRSKLEEFVRQASATEAKVNVVATIDHNIASGITRTSREVMADLILLGWPQKSGVLQKLIGEKVESIVTNTDKVVVICDLLKPLVLHKRIVVLAPPLAEREGGFERWVLKVGMLAQELSAQVHLCSTGATAVSFQNALKVVSLSPALTFLYLDDIDSFPLQIARLQENDLLIVVSSRKGFVSYDNALDNLLVKMDRHAEQISKIIIYPQQVDTSEKLDVYDDVSAEPLNRSIETIERIGKGIGDIFRRDKDDKDEEEPER
jgi:hypothetical protein